MIIRFAGGVKERKVSRVTMGFLGCVHTIVSDMRKEKKVNDALSLGQTGFEMPGGPPRYTDRQRYECAVQSEYLGWSYKSEAASTEMLSEATAMDHDI